MRTGSNMPFTRGLIADISDPERLALFVYNPDAVLAENLIHAGQAACSYSLRIPVGVGAGNSVIAVELRATAPPE